MQIQNIPPLTHTVVQVLAFPEDGSISDLEKLIQGDQGMVSGILRVANSSYYGQPGTVHLLKRGILLIGVKSVKNLALLHSVNQFTTNCKGAMARHLRSFPVLSALVSREIVKQTPLAEEVFLLCILRRIGLAVMVRNNRGLMKDIIERADKTGNLLELEREETGTDHVEVGIEARKTWNLPAYFDDLILSERFFPDKRDYLHPATVLAILCALPALKELSIEIPAFHESFFSAEEFQSLEGIDIEGLKNDELYKQFG